MATALSLNGAALRHARPAALRLRQMTPGPRFVAPMRAGSSRADDSSPAPSEMSVEGALKLLGVSEGASFDEILRAKNAVLSSCKDDLDAAAKVEAAYDMLLMKSLSQRRAGKVASNSIRYADVKPVRSAGSSSMPQWMQTTLKRISVTIEAPSASNLGIQTSLYGALMVFTYASGSSTALPGANTGADIPGVLLATGFGASLYFLTKNNVSLGKATVITAGSLVAGALVGSAVENWLQVDIVPFMGIHSPAVIAAVCLSDDSQSFKDSYLVFLVFDFQRNYLLRSTPVASTSHAAYGVIWTSDKMIWTFIVIPEVDFASCFLRQPKANWASSNREV